FLQAEDGIRAFHVTGVQSCALPILTLADISLAAAQAGKQKIGKALGKLVEKGKLDAATSAAILDRITPVGELEALAPCDAVIERSEERRVGRGGGHGGRRSDDRQAM